MASFTLSGFASTPSADIDVTGFRMPQGTIYPK